MGSLGSARGQPLAGQDGCFRKIGLPCSSDRWNAGSSPAPWEQPARPEVPRQHLPLQPGCWGRTPRAHDHHAAASPFSSLQSRDNRQGEADTDVSFPAVAAASADGKRCIDKVEMIEEIEYDDVVHCDHSYDRRCHTTYVTQYESQQEEECEENFRKSCF